MKLNVGYENARSIERTFKSFPGASFSLSELIQIHGCQYNPLGASALVLNLDFLLVQRRLEKVRGAFVYRQRQEVAS